MDREAWRAVIHALNLTYGQWQANPFLGPPLSSESVNCSVMSNSLQPHGL